MAPRMPPLLAGAAIAGSAVLAAAAARAPAAALAPAAGGKPAAGGLPASGGKPADGSREAMQAAGLAPAQVLVASTRNGAAAMGRLADLGTIEKGKIADLLVVGGDPSTDIANLRKLETVVRAGVVRPVAELRARR